jgi:predicted Rossmann-fold nucleotide-binding protein
VRPNRAVTTVPELLAHWPDLQRVAVVGLDLRDMTLDWSHARFDGAVFLGCRLDDTQLDRIVCDRGTVVSGLDDVPFTAYRAELYTYEELAPVDARIGGWFAASATDFHDGIVRAVHDATIDTAVARLVAGRRVVGVMGGHAVARNAPLYRRVALVGRALARAGYYVATGGGPGAMEAANFGAWLSTYDDEVFDDAIAMLATSPSYARTATGYVERALEVRERWPHGGESLGVPTWLYLDEPTSAFATKIAKYFTNSVRENGLLAIARSGVVYAPGGPGTEQEIFTDAAQNSLTLYEVRSPMVFFGRAHYERERHDLVTAVRRQAAEFGWDELVAVRDRDDEVVEFIADHDPADAARTTVAPRRAHGRRR